MTDVPYPPAPQGIAPLAPLEIEVLGQVMVRLEGRPVDELLSQPKRLGLLLFLALARTPRVRRETILAAFWRELDDRAARAALSQALSVLRRWLGDARIETFGTTEIALARRGFRCDAERFEAALDQGDLNAAARLYGGQLIPDLIVANTPGFDEWRDTERERLRRRHVELLEHVVKHAELELGPAAAMETWARLVQLEPLNESYAAGLIRTLVATGKRDRALGEAEACRRRLNEELGIRPGPELLAAIEVARVGLRANGDAVATTASSAPAQSTSVARRPYRRWLAIAMAATIVVISGVALLAGRSPSTPSGSEEEPVLVTALVDRSEQPTLKGLGELAAGWIIDGLVRQGGIPVVDPVGVLTASRSGRALTVPASLDSLIRVSKELKVTQVVIGAIDVLGDSVALSARVVNVRDGRVLGTARVLSSPNAVSVKGIQELRERVIGLIAAARDQTVRSVGGGLMAPPTLAAYRSFTQGLEVFGRNDDSGALPYFLAAARADSGFVLPLIWARYAAANSGQQTVYDSLGAVNQRVLDVSGNRLSELERLALTTETPLSDSSSRLSSAARAAGTRLAQLAPGSSFAFNMAQGLMNQFRYADAARLLEDVLRARWAGSWRAAAFVADFDYHMLGRFDRELEISRMTLADWPEDRSSREEEVEALIALGRTAEAATSISTLRQGPPPDVMSSLLSMGVEGVVHGQPKLGRELLHEALRIAEANAGATPAGLGFIANAYLENWPEAERCAREAMDRARREGQPPTIRAVVELAAVLGKLGRSNEARGLAERVATDSTLRPGPAANRADPRAYERPLGRAMIAASLGQRDSALAFLEQVRAVELETGVAGLSLGRRIFDSPFFAPLRSEQRFLRIIGMD